MTSTTKLDALRAQGEYSNVIMVILLKGYKAIMDS